MKFVSTKSAKGLAPGTQVYTLNDKGEYGVARLQSRIEDAKGQHFKFEVPQYSDRPLPVQAVVVDNITHVCLMKDRSTVAATNGVQQEVVEE